MTGFNLIKFDGKPIEKLLDVVSNAIGTAYKPRAIRREADAKAYALKVISRAKAEALVESKEIEAEYYNRIEKRLTYQQLSKQQNIDNVVDIAIEQLSHEEAVSDKEVNKDWTTRFFNIVEDISDEEMQYLWGKILAGEVKQPNSYSLRTLDILRNLTTDEANMFTKLAELALYNPGEKNCFVFMNIGFLESHLQISTMNILRLSEAGLLYNDHNLSIKFEYTESSGSIIIYGDKGIGISKEVNAPESSMQIFSFTQSGTELTKLIASNYNEDYIKEIAKVLKNKGTTVSLGDIEKIDEDNFKLVNEEVL